MNIEPAATVSAKQTGNTNACLRKVVSTGEYSELIALTVPPGEETGDETYDDNDQVLFVVEGRGEAILNGQAEPAADHDAIFVPAGTPRNLRNPGVADLKIFAVCSPPLDSEANTGARGHGIRNFYAIAQSAPVTSSDQRDADRLPFPGGIKWAEWKAPLVRNVLFATDFSAAAGAALHYAVSIARHFRSRLHVTHVVNSDGYGLMPPETAERFLTAAQDTAGLKIAELMRSSQSEDVPYEAVVKGGPVVDTLLDIVQRSAIDLVVLGTQGRTGLDKLMLGSVAEKVFRLARCPVLTVGPKTPSFTPEALLVKHILYPMELLPDVPEAAAYALSLAKAYDAELTFLNVIERSRSTREEQAWINVAAEHWFEDRVAPDLGLGEKAHFVQKAGDPATAILACARQKGADLIVMNVRGAHPLVAGRFPGVAHRVVTEAPCPVLTIR